MIPMLKEVLRQGADEGLLAAPHPEQMANVLVTLILGLSDALGELILAGQSMPTDLAQVEALVVTYTYAIERALGVAPVSLKLIDMETLKQWFC